MNRNTLRQLGLLAVIVAAAAPAARAQEPSAAAPAIRQPGLIERSIAWASDRFDSAGGTHDGVYPELGHMIPGSGLAAGPGIRQHVFGDRAVVDASAAVSWRRYTMMRGGFELPALASNRLSLGGEVKYEDFTQINYFGIGAASAEDARTNYRLSNVDFSGSAVVRPAFWLSIGGRAGYLRSLDIGSGRSALYPSIEQRFDESTAPGLSLQPRYQHADLFVQADSRDVPGYPSRGGVYQVTASAYRDADRTGHSFGRFDAEGTQYLSLFHHSSVIALRGRMTTTTTSGGNVVPFYLMPTVGGDGTLRGYANYRFRDLNAAVVTAEYRWRVFRVMDAALFTDAGTVAPTLRDLSREPISRDYGFGIRLHSSTTSVARLDIARGQEGTRVVFSLVAPLGQSRRDVAPYVP